MCFALMPAELLLSKYVFLKTLGHTQYGKVKLARHVNTHAEVAVKICEEHHMRKYRIGQRQFADDPYKEVAMHTRLSSPGHRNLVRFHEAHEDAASSSLYIVMENVAGGDLCNRIATTCCSESVAKHVCKQLMLGVQYMHSQGVCHRDLSPENILLDANGDVKITDFGMADDITPGGCVGTIGKLPYMAPEVYDFAKTGVSFDGAAADIWSCGVILYALLVGSLPFKIPHCSDQQFRYIMNDGLRSLWDSYELGRYFSDDVTSVLTLMLQRDPLYRPSAADVLSHAWFQPSTTDVLEGLAVRTES